tara:strand:+ start:2332 stop:2604 length:273 start_codon:yes stop_codon:yes gene_type:complete
VKIDLSSVPTEDLLDEIKRRMVRLESVQPKERYRLKELSAILGVSTFTIQRWCREGMPHGGKKVDLEYAKVGRDYVFTGDEAMRIQRLRS